MTADQLLAVRAESLYEELGGDLCICQNVDVPHWCEKCQQRIAYILTVFRRLRSEGEVNGLKRADDIAHRVAADANPDETLTAYYSGIERVVDAIESALSADAVGQPPNDIRTSTRGISPLSSSTPKGER